MSIMIQPVSRTMDSETTPDSASIPASASVFVDDRNDSPSALESGGVSGECSRARSSAESTIQVSLDIWSRTARAARLNRSTDCASEPGRRRSAVNAHSVVGAVATSSW